MSVARTIHPFIIYALRKFTDEMLFELLVGEKRQHWLERRKITVKWHWRRGTCSGSGTSGGDSLEWRGCDQGFGLLRSCLGRSRRRRRSSWNDDSAMIFVN